MNGFIPLLAAIAVVPRHRILRPLDNKHTLPDHHVHTEHLVIKTHYMCIESCTGQPSLADALDRGRVVPDGSMCLVQSLSFHWVDACIGYYNMQTAEKQKQLAASTAQVAELKATLARMAEHTGEIQLVMSIAQGPVGFEARRTP